MLQIISAPEKELQVRDSSCNYNLHNNSKAWVRSPFEVKSIKFPALFSTQKQRAIGFQDLKTVGKRKVQPKLTLSSIALSHLSTNFNHLVSSKVAGYFLRLSHGKKQHLHIIYNRSQLQKFHKNDAILKCKVHRSKLPYWIS